MAIYEHSTTDNTKTQTYVPLNDGSLYPVPDGADPQTVRRIQNQILANREAKANGTKKPSRRSSPANRNSSRVNYAELAIAGEVLETVLRANETEPGPTPDENIIIIHSAGGTTYVNRKDWGLSYA